MNVLALYDIHGNVDALEAVLADPRAAPADAVVVGGDVVPGPFAGATLARLDAIGVPLHWVRGNGEREVATVLGVERPAADDMAARTAAEIGDERARRLGELALTVQLDGVLYCHASPRRDDEMLTRLSSPQRWATALDGVTAGLVVAGHTHQQDDRVVGDVRFVNAGSVGLPYEGDGAARWLWIADGEPELRQTGYDAAGAGAHDRGRLARRALGPGCAPRADRADRGHPDLRGDGPRLGPLSPRSRRARRARGWRRRRAR